MDGTVIDYVKYRDGHSDLGKQAIRVEIIALPSNLTIRNFEGQALFSVPWENFKDIQPGSIYKTGLDIVGALLIRSIPGLNILNAADSFHDGFWLTYWDSDIQRKQQVFFDAGSQRKADEIIRQIYRCRDQYHRQTRNMSGPQRK